MKQNETIPKLILKTGEEFTYLGKLDVLEERHPEISHILMDVMLSQEYEIPVVTLGMN